MQLDPLLEKFQSEYHYLFARVYRHAHSQDRQNMEESYLMPNVARRLLEAFLAFRQPHVSGELWQKLNSIDFDEAKKVRIARLTNTYSHSDVVDEPDHNLSVLAETSGALKELLELMEKEDAYLYP